MKITIYNSEALRKLVNVCIIERLDFEVKMIENEFIDYTEKYEVTIKDKTNE
jgi:hypothetical protein